MYNYIRLFALLATYICIAYGANDVVTENLKMFVDGKEYFIKAMCYEPAPLGKDQPTKTGDIGGGFCSPKLAPFGMVTTTCYDSDYYDGAGDAPGRPQPTEGGWFQPVWRRDFPIMKSLGVNTLRIYNANPTTKQASIYYPEAVPLPYGKDHVPFMDMANDYGFKVVFPLISDYGMMTTYSDGTFKRLLRWQIDEIGNHPALLMWSFGNELPLFGNQGLIDLLNRYIAYIKQYTFTKWGRKIPVTTAVVDLPNSYDTFAATLDVDVFTTNAGYRGVTFTDLWSGGGVSQGWHKLSCRYNKPVFIGEMGWMSLNNQINQQTPDWFNQMWKDLIDHMDQGCIGGAFFEYSDEILKTDALQQTMGLVHFTVNSTGGQPSTEIDVWNVDVANPKDIIFNAVKSGSYQGKFYNMNSSPFYLANRGQSLLGSSSASVCDAFALKACPAANTCSFHGICDRQMGTCTCNNGWTGADCSQAVCSGGCSGRGACVSSVSPPVCNCQAGWTGPTCAVQVNSGTCATNCVSGNGACNSNGVCVCFKGWFGHDCAIPDTSYPPVSGSTTTTTTSPTPSTSTSTTTTRAPTTTTTTTTTTTSTTATPTTTTTTTRAPTTTTTTTLAPTTTTTPTPVTTSTTRTPTTTSSTTSAPITTRTPSTTTTTTTTVSPTTTSTSTTRAPTTTPAPTTPTTTTTTTTTASAPSSACGPLKSCGAACFDDQQYSCFGSLLCPIGMQKCGLGCYPPSSYTCVNDQLRPL